jgi:hypothetical protein
MTEISWFMHPGLHVGATQDIPLKVFVINQLDKQFFFMYVYFYSLHVSGNHVPIIRNINCINTTSVICHSEN